MIKLTVLCAQMLSRVQLFVTPWTVAHQVPLSMGTSGKNTGVGYHFLLQRIFQTQGWSLCLFYFLHWQADSLLPMPRVKTDRIRGPSLQKKKNKD